MYAILPPPILNIYKLNNARADMNERSRAMANNIPDQFLSKSALTLLAYNEADINRNGKIDENEKSIFAKCLKQYGDTDGSGDISDEEAQVYAQRFQPQELSEDKLNAKNRLAELEKQYDLSKPENLPKDVLNEFVELMKKTDSMTSLSRAIDQKEHMNKIGKLIDYITSFKDDMLSKINTNTNNALVDFFDNKTDKQQ